MSLPLKMIDTDVVSARLRERSIDLTGRRLLMTRIAGSEQERDLALPPNCAGFGRVRHFLRAAERDGWPSNPLPIDPALRSLGLPPDDHIEAQVFQNAACNWRCWYCFVPYDLLSANPKHSGWLSAEEMVDLYTSEIHPPPMIDLTGGQPDLVPEWVPWTMRALRERGLEGKVYLWSDDNLSNDYFWRYLGSADRELITGFQGYGRVCCFKGFDSRSFAFNTLAHPNLFDQQFSLFARFLSLGIDLYAYATFTTPHDEGIESSMADFVDRLQRIHPNLPLRTVPLEIRVFTPVEGRIQAVHEQAMLNQWRAVRAWQDELAQRFSASELLQSVTEVEIGRKRR